MSARDTALIVRAGIEHRAALIEEAQWASGDDLTYLLNLARKLGRLGVALAEAGETDVLDPRGVDAVLRGLIAEDLAEWERLHGEER